MKKMKKMKKVILCALLISCNQQFFGMKMKVDVTNSDIKQEKITKIEKYLKSMENSEQKVKLKLFYNPKDTVEHYDPIFPLWVKIVLDKNDIYDIKEKVQEEVDNLRHRAKEFLCQQEEIDCFARLD